MIRDEKAQALMEFILVLPIILLLFFGMIDLGRIVIRKNELESIVTDKVIVWENSNTSIDELKKYIEEDNIKVSVSQNESTSFVTIDLYEEISWLTPMVSNLFGDYTIHIKRVIANE